jgi:hypothetical protein
MQQSPTQAIQRKPSNPDFGAAAPPWLNRFDDNGVSSQQSQIPTQMQQRCMDEVVVKLEMISSQLAGSVTQLTNGMSQQIQATMSAIEDKFLSSMQSSGAGAQQQSILGADWRMDASMPSSNMGMGSNIGMNSNMGVNSNIGMGPNMGVEFSVTAVAKFEQIGNSLMRHQKDLNEECSKNISMGIGVVGNSLRMQIESLQAEQQTRYRESEKTLKFLLEKVQQQLQKDSEKMQVIEMTMKECAEKAAMHCADKATKRQMEELREFQGRIQDSMREQVETTKKTNAVIASALGSGASMRMGDMSMRIGDQSPQPQRGRDMSPMSTEGLYRNEQGQMIWGSRAR